MIELELDTFFHNDETLNLQSAGMPIPDDLFSYRKVTFYSVDSIFPEDGDKTTRVISGGIEYSAAMDYKKLKKLISEQIRRGNDIYNSNRN